MPKILLTGATGYIGGDFLHAVTKAHPEVVVIALVRQDSAAAKLKTDYPQVEVVKGDLDTDTVLSEASSRANVTFNLAATSHLASLKSIHKGAVKANNGAHIVQITGATMVSQDEIKAKKFGKSTDNQYGDVQDESAICTIVRNHQNRTVDNYMLDLVDGTSGIGGALVIPSLIYGQGRGPGNRRSIQVPELTRIALQRKRAVRIGAGENIWSNIHIWDLSAMLVKLYENAISGPGDSQAWGAHGLFFAGSHPGVTFKSLAQQIANTAVQMDLLSSREVDEISAAEADALSPHASAILGTNARTLSERAQKVLGWSAVSPSLEEELEQTVALEAQQKSSL